MRVSPNLLERTPVIEQLPYSQLPQALSIRPGVTAVIGSGGKNHDARRARPSHRRRQAREPCR